MALRINFKNFENILKIKRGKVSALILAAGSAERFGGGKHAYPVDGIPVFIRSVRAFEESPYIDEIILVVKKSDREDVISMLKAYDFKKLKKIVTGGDTRQQSALNGFEACGDCEYVAIHDAARCLVTPEMIESVIRAAYQYRAASAAHKMTDTVKTVDDNMFVTDTPDRSRVYGVSTPQIFLSDLYRAAAYTARDAGFSGTDDCSLAEYAGFPVKLVDVGDENIKITYFSDIERAESILRRRKELSKI